jgi:hypothetical protein
LAKVNGKATDKAASRRSAWPEGELEEGDGADSDRFFCFRRRLAGRQVQTGPAVESINFTFFFEFSGLALGHGNSRLEHLSWV